MIDDPLVNENDSKKFKQSKDCFYLNILYANKHAVSDEHPHTEDFSCIDEDMIRELKSIKQQISFDRRNALFENRLHLVNDVLVSGKILEHIKHCSRRPDFVYAFQNDQVQCYEKYLKFEKDFPFTVDGDLETTNGYVSEIEGGSMFATSYCLTFNFHPKLEMTPITCLRSFAQNEKELEFITIPQKFWPLIDHEIRYVLRMVVMLR